LVTRRHLLFGATPRLPAVDPRAPESVAAHESPKTTKLYDRTSDQITLDEVERIWI
jgi:hypothetical protein